MGVVYHVAVKEDMTLRKSVPHPQQLPPEKEKRGKEKPNPI